MESLEHLRAFEELFLRVFRQAEHIACAAPKDLAIWSAASATPRLETVEMTPIAWTMQASIPGHHARAYVVVALTPGEARVGVILPRTTIFHGGQDLRQAIACIYNGREATLQRQLPGGAALIDWHFSDEPFSARWMREAIADPYMTSATASRLAFNVLTIWRGTVQIIATAGQFDLSNDLLVTSKQEIPVFDLAKKLPFVVYDSMYEPTDQRWLTIVRSALDAEEMRERLREEGFEADVRETMRVDVGVDDF